jgi:hypothetical protein
VDAETSNIFDRENINCVHDLLKVMTAAVQVFAVD